MAFSADGAARQARGAALALATLGLDERNDGLAALAAALRADRSAILAANRADLQQAGQHGAAGAPLFRRLDLAAPGKYETMCAGVDDVQRLGDPLGKVSYAVRLDAGLELRRVSCPIGVLLVVFEARPEVVVSIAALALKSGNAVILKGGRESGETLAALGRTIAQALQESRIPPHAVTLVHSREQVASLLALDRYIDLCIPRGSNELVRTIRASTKIPVLGHADGICSIYIAPDARPEIAAAILLDAKTSYPAGCNAAETLLLHADSLHTLWPAVATALSNAGVELRCSDECLAPIAALGLSAVPACAADFATEFLSLTLAVMSVSSLDEAITHINTHSSHHTDCIITEDAAAARLFQQQVDSAGVYWNASTRFADGFRYGFGAEVGIATGKIHARGPVGLEGLTTYKYLLSGSGHVASAYGIDKRQYLHEPLD